MAETAGVTARHVAPVELPAGRPSTRGTHPVDLITAADTHLERP